MIQLEKNLNNFDPSIRKQALLEAKQSIDKGEIVCKKATRAHNMHCHSFFSYNGYGYSPSYIVYLAKINGWHAVGLVDFDVLDGVDEFLAAAKLLNVKAACGMESRVFIPELADVEINSPGEPGIAYHLGMGFTTGDVPAPQRAFAESMKRQANDRTRKLVELVNDYLAPVSVDFEAAAKRFTPFGNVTERHVCQAYREAAEARFQEPAARAAFWSEKLKLSQDEAAKLISDPVKLEGMIRAKTMKQGGPGYVAPTPASFPTIEAMNQFIIGCNARPTLAWLNGFSAGEADVDRLLDLHIGYGAKAATLIPDRNYNVADPAKQAKLIAELDRFIAGCLSRKLPLLAGTEMNAPGQKLVDDFDVPCLKKHLDDFVAGCEAF